MVVFVNNPGNLTMINRQKLIMQSIKRFEQTPNSVGSLSTQIWLNHYLSFIALQVIFFF